ncbi:UDP-glucuronosyltransferase 2B18 [Orchesella cincta]|uniref:UDP-glucuronosyltransferase 2B18 n=1 Tax=Orchesella cincta TaxID=48709 RepID=A0A1D2MDW5_ORCCI|nr:UDP-glucuronosyltransferase 2B18 [Orchesella cincta]
MASLWIFPILSLLLGACLGDRILFLLPLASPSHVNVHDPLIKALGERGHEIINLSPIKSPSMPPTVKTIQLITSEELHATMPDVFEERRKGQLQFMLNSSTFDHIHNACVKVMKHPTFHEVLKNEKFDLVVLDIVLNQCMFGVIPHFKAPSILLSTSATWSLFTTPFGNRLPPSFVPCLVMRTTDHMSFLERLTNTVVDTMFGWLYYGVMMKMSENLYRKHLPNGDQLPGIYEIHANANLVLFNDHYTYNQPRPLLPDLIEVGGMHCRPAKKLPKVVKIYKLLIMRIYMILCNYQYNQDLDDFLSNSGKDGFIFFSLGSIVKAKDMPENYRKVFLNVFSRLKQRVIWKWETETMPDLPPNVKLSKWLPQQDVLGHPNIRLFMTHGGLLSTQESVYHGVPVLGIPVFGDQDTNIGQAEIRGYAKMVEIVDITEERLETAILELLNNPTYTQKAKKLSKLVKDLPQTPLDKAVYWTEYILRHKGAPHLRSAARDLNFFQYYVLDVAAVLLIFPILFSILLGKCLGDKILFVLPFASPSHVHVHEPLIRALGERGHEIINLSPIKSPDMPPTVTQIALLTSEELQDGSPDAFEARQNGIIRFFLNSSTYDHVHNACVKVLEHPKFQEVLTKKFDLVIFDIVLNQCVIGVIPHFKAPSILLSTSATWSLFTSPFGNRLPPSFVPSPFLTSTDHMSFLERLTNTVADAVSCFLYYAALMRMFEGMYRQYLPNGDKLPGSYEITANANLLLFNDHFAYNQPKPLLPDVVEVGGMHCRPPNKLPKDLEKFLSDSGEDGFIFFSLGSIVKAKNMPENYRKVFLNVFSRLKQRVIWKWETETMPDLPPNVKLSKWLPQQDVLGHPNIRVFMTHGGLLSTQESVYHGVPLLGIPVFGDQDTNMGQAEIRGHAKVVEILDMTEERLESAILELLNNPTYARKAKELSKLVKDLPQTPLDKAVYWTEYILRHKGARHLRSAARDLNFFQYYVLDVAAVLLVTFVLILYLIFCCCKSIYRRACGRKSIHFKKE